MEPGARWRSDCPWVFGPPANPWRFTVPAKPLPLVPIVPFTAPTVTSTFSPLAKISVVTAVTDLDAVAVGRHFVQVLQAAAPADP